MQANYVNIALARYVSKMERVRQHILNFLGSTVVKIDRNENMTVFRFTHNPPQSASVRARKKFARKTIDMALSVNIFKSH